MTTEKKILQVITEQKEYIKEFKKAKFTWLNFGIR